MSWASDRTATRVEDMAYCLLGLFDVHLPPLYGEGSKAFLRLQLEILRTSDDESLFAWREYVPYGMASGMLATSVTAFQASGHIRQLNHPKALTTVRDGYSPPSPYQMANQGLYMDVIMKSPPEKMPPYLENTKIAVIRCTSAASELKDTAIAIFLHQIGPDQYMRINPHRLASLHVPNPDWWFTAPRTLVYVRQVNLNIGSYFSSSSFDANFHLYHQSSRLLAVKETFTRSNSSKYAMWAVGHGALFPHNGSQFKVILLIYCTRYADAVKQSSTSRNRSSIATLRLNSSFGNSTGIVLKTEPGEEFGLLLFLYGRIGGIKVMIPKGPMSFEDSTRDFDFSGEMKKCSGLDRMSILLKSGTAVSVVLKSEGLRGEGEGLYWYGVEITVDPSGKLLWPDPDRSIKTKKQPDWELHVLDFGEVKEASIGEDVEITATPDLRNQPLSTGQQLDKDGEESSRASLRNPGMMERK